jgi:hypothetical protein
LRRLYGQRHQPRTSTAAGVQLTDQLPAGLIFVAAAPNDETYDPTTGLWDVGTLPTFAPTMPPVWRLPICCRPA